jgi:hypothetical protein
LQAVTLKERLFTVDQVINNQQIIFVCHSMGGIVVRKFIVERILDIKKHNLSIGLFLVASPSLGSDYANYVKLLSNLVGNAQATRIGDRHLGRQQECCDDSCRHDEFCLDVFHAIPPSTMGLDPPCVNKRQNESS